MKLDQLTKKYPVIASLVVLTIVIVLTETPVDSIRSILAPLTGRFYGDYLADVMMNALGVICLLLAAATVGLGGKLGLQKPRPWATVVLVWPLVLLAFLSGSDYLLGEIELVFDPLLFVIFIFLYLSIGAFEEILFRGYIQGFLMRRWGNNCQGILVSVLLANLIFSGAHITNLVMGRATLLYTASQLVYAFSFGVFFSALYVRSGSLLPGIALHMLYDFVVNLEAFMPNAQPRSEIVRSTTPEGLFMGIVITLPLLLIGLFYLRKSKLQAAPAVLLEA